MIRKMILVLKALYKPLWDVYYGIYSESQSLDLELL